MANALLELQQLGQSPWHDNIHRALLTSGALERMVRDGDITGLTSNPTIFEQAIAQHADYDEALATLVAAGRKADAIVDALIVEDIQAAADVFLPVWTRTKRADGYVSIEVSPTLAHDTAGTVREAKRLWRAVNRPNLMVKIPATPEGIPAIEETIAGGMNVNVTLIFSLQRYDEVMEAYLGGLTRRLEAGMRVDRIASVASFFVSRVDTIVDKQLDERIGGTSGEQRALLERLRGKAAIAQAKLAYQAFRDKFGGDRFSMLAREGARPQRPLWASTSTKNPSYPDVYYVEALIGPETVNTMPPATLAAYKDHGHPENRLDFGMDRARAVLAQLAHAGIGMDAVTAQLEREGVAAFAASYQALVDVVATRREALRIGARSDVRLGTAERSVALARTTLATHDVAARLWRKDPTLWKPNVAGAQADIARRLAWLDAPSTPSAILEDLAAFAADVRATGITHALLCGAGSAVLAPEALHRALGVAKGGLELSVLDAVDPTAVLAAATRSDVARTLYVLSSPSGALGDLDAAFRFLWQRARAKVGPKAGAQFVAIAPPGTALERLAQEHGFRRVVQDPSEVAARFTALSLPGLLPAALMGHDLPKLLERAHRMATACSSAVPPAHNPGLALGAILGALHRAGRDKLTLVVPDKLTAFAGWLEQLVAESTGKEGNGLVPVTNEPVGPPSLYGKDRLIVHFRLGAKQDRAMAALARAGHPVIAIKLTDGYDLGGEFVRWQVAVAIAGHLLEINPFDQPNVQEATSETQRLLDEHPTRDALPPPPLVLAPGTPEFAAKLGSHLAAARGRRYVAVTAFVAATPRRERLLRDIRVAI
ncbi:MAG TPA: bifunctional transaldolase/phosoglucose isomerase, partial [Candidatus Binatia bacterium]|nr:bifunctional transaldolase/phosoglucose isomerase [Candidatus Binatia bacterium]